MRTDSEVLRQGGAGAASTQAAAFSPLTGVGEQRRMVPMRLRCLKWRPIPPGVAERTRGPPVHEVPPETGVTSATPVNC